MKPFWVEASFDKLDREDTEKLRVIVTRGFDYFVPFTRTSEIRRGFNVVQRHNLGSFQRPISFISLMRRSQDATVIISWVNMDVHGSNRPKKFMTEGKFSTRM